jgi:hypothetical protein
MSAGVRSAGEFEYAAMKQSTQRDHFLAEIGQAKVAGQVALL